MVSANQKSSMSLLLALVPVVLLIGLLAADVVAFGEDSSYGANQIAMLLAAFVAGGIGMAKGVQWSTIREAIGNSIAQTSEAMLILLMIGALSGTWLMAGIIPAFIHYGLQILSPEIFLFAACVICAVLSLATGSSWGTVGTVGVALIGIGTALGLHPGWVAGAIISGAYFGDKMSPLERHDQHRSSGRGNRFVHTHSVHDDHHNSESVHCLGCLSLRGIWRWGEPRFVGNGFHQRLW